MTESLDSGRLLDWFIKATRNILTKHPSDDYVPMAILWMVFDGKTSVRLMPVEGDAGQPPSAYFDSFFAGHDQRGAPAAALALSHADKELSGIFLQVAVRGGCARSAVLGLTRDAGGFLVAGGVSPYESETASVASEMLAKHFTPPAL